MQNNQAEMYACTVGRSGTITMVIINLLRTYWTPIPNFLRAIVSLSTVQLNVNFFTVGCDKQNSSG